MKSLLPGVVVTLTVRRAAGHVVTRPGLYAAWRRLYEGDAWRELQRRYGFAVRYTRMECVLRADDAPPDFYLHVLLTRLPKDPRALYATIRLLWRDTVAAMFGDAFAPTVPVA